MSWQPENADKWIKEGISHYNAKRYNACLDACERAIQLDPDCARAYHGKGLALAQQNRFGEALLAYQKASHLAPENAKILAEMAELGFKKGDYQTSGLSYRRAIQLDSQFEAVYVEKSKMLLDNALLNTPNKTFKLNTSPLLLSSAIIAFHDVLLFNPDDGIAFAEIGKIQEKRQKEKEGLWNCRNCYTGTVIYTERTNSADITVNSFQTGEEVRIFLVERDNIKKTQIFVEDSLKYLTKMADGWKIPITFQLLNKDFIVEVLRKETVIAYGYYKLLKGDLRRHEERNMYLTTYKPQGGLGERGSNNSGHNSIIYAPGRTGGRNRRARRG
ncbi:MAG: tetratricopeptide repeat protein [Ktedonobacteraceae bacterium]